jgi:hypothetical protein
MLHKCQIVEVYLALISWPKPAEEKLLSPEEVKEKNNKKRNVYKKWT